MRAAAVLMLAAAAIAPSVDAAITIDILRSVSSLPPHIVGLFEEPIAFHQIPDGPYYVFDRRGHAVYSVDADKRAARKLIEIGQEQGRIIQPRGFDTTPTGTMVIADAPRGVERVQIFGPAGFRLGGFMLPGRPAPTVSVGALVLNGIASIQFAGDNLLISHPESGALFTEYTRAGVPIRGIGRLRETGHEQDRDLHLALNSGLPLVDPTGGYFYVFLAGRPMFRKYDARGTLIFERHIEGREIDDYLASLPTQWPRRRVEDRELPYVTPTVRTAAVDATGGLWVSLSLPYTYVYDAHGDKARTVQFRGAGTISPTSLFFTGDGRLLVTPGCYEFNPRPL